MSAVVTMPPGPSQTCLVKFGYVSKAYLCVYVLLQSDESLFLNPGLIHLPGWSYCQSLTSCQPLNQQTV